MATSIYFNSRVTSIPGSYSEVDASGLASVGLGATGIVACIGEAEGAAPGTVISISNPGKLGKTFRSGDLLEGGTMLFDPSKDPDIPAGAQEVKFVKVNPATQSTTTLADAVGNPSVTFTSADYGAFTEKISVSVSDGTTAGTKAVQVTLDSTTETFDNIGADGVATLQYVGTAAAATASYTDVAGLSASVVDTQAATSDQRFQASQTGLAADIVGQPSGAEVLSVVSTDAADVQDVVVYGIAGGVADSETITLTGLAPAVGLKTFTSVLGVWSASAHTGTVTLAGNVTATTVCSGTQASYGVSDWSSAPLTPTADADRPKLVSSDAAATQNVMLVGVVGGVADAEILTLTGTTEVQSLKSWDSISYVMLGLVPGGDTITLSSSPSWPTKPVTVVSSDAADTTQVITIMGLDAAGVPQSENLGLTGTVTATSSGTFSAVFAVLLDAAAAGTVTVNSVAVSATAPAWELFTVTTGDLSRGLSAARNFVLNGTTLDWAITPGVVPSFHGLVVGTDAGGAPAMEYLSAASGTTSTSWATIEYVTLSAMAPSEFIDLTYAPYALAPASYTTFDQWEAFFADQAEWTLTKTMATPAASYTLTDLDAFTGQDCTGAGYSILDILKDLVSAINAGSALVTAATAAAASLPPANTTTPVFLTGGSEGATSFADWQAALDLLRDYRVNTIVVLTTDAAVHAAAIAHCSYMCAAGRSERDCLLGAPSATTMPAAKALALAMNTRHARLLIQDAERFNTSGVVERFAPPFTACIAAGMQAGSDVGTSLTFKYLNVLSVYGNDASYTIQDDANELIGAGLCMVEKVPNRGWRWLRNITTYLIDDNLAYSEASVNEAVNYAVYSFRTALEAVIGQKGFAGTVTAAQGISISILGQLVDVGAITSHRNLSVTLTDDVMTVDVEIAPVNPVNFVKSTIHLVSATFAAE